MTNDLESFYRGRKVLLTGHTGFKGTWMSTFLELLGSEVCGYSLPVNTSSFYSKVSPKIVYHFEGDIADAQKVLQITEYFQPEIIFHFASHSSLDGSMKIPEYILRTNLMGVVNVLEAVRKSNSVKAVVVVTSDKCYLNTSIDEPYTEESILGGKDPYSISKVCQELLSSCYADTFFENNLQPIGIATARASNVIGAGDYNITRLMPYLLDCFSNGNVPQIRNPQAVRPWQYVLDVLYGYLLLAEKIFLSAGITTEYNGAYNFGPAEDGFSTVGDIVKKVSRQYNDFSYVIKAGDDPVKKETNVLRLDSTKAKKVLGWRAKKTLDETIDLTVDFTKREKNGNTPRALCREQIMRYIKEIH